MVLEVAKKFMLCYLLQLCMFINHFYNPASLRHEGFYLELIVFEAHNLVGLISQWHRVLKHHIAFMLHRGRIIAVYHIIVVDQTDLF